MVSHAALPVPLLRSDGVITVFFASRDDRNRSRVGSFDFSLEEPDRPSNVSKQPLVDLGTLGAFDDSGVTPSCLVESPDGLRLYYTGWSLGVTVPFYFHIGVAVSTDGGDTFSRVSRAPVLGRTEHDPYLIASPWILIENGVWRMWYVSGAGWRQEEGGPKHYYNIRYAESSDGIRWSPTGRVCIDFADATEYAFGRPCVRRHGDLYRMWYPYRGAAYRMGYAESADGLNWTRMDDEVGIGVSAEGWDSEMVAYPVVFAHKAKLHMLYNGNGYGATGIGLASADEGNH